MDIVELKDKLMKNLVLICIFLHPCNGMTSDVKNPPSPNQKYFEVIMDRTEVVFEEPSIVEWHIRVKKVNKTRSLVGYLTYHELFGNNIKVEGKVLKKQGGEYRYLPYSFPPAPFCDALENEKFVYPDMARQSDFPEDVTKYCPFQPGNYSFYGAAPNLENAPTIAAPTGEYAGEMYYYKEDKHIATYRIYGYINNV